ncbi:DUF3575 domain-containing protein [Polaribacter sp.]|nr:DUF3575 domain-containing protein [Polaribacter sp.]
MKKFTLLLFLLSSFIAFSQDYDFEYPQDENKKHELKISPTSLIAIAAIDVSYERLINSSTSYGVSLFLNTEGEGGEINYPRDFSVTPFYRWFFNERTFARGFFVEGFGMLNSYKDDYYDYGYDSFGNYQSTYVEGENNVRFALGISVGGKFVLKSGFTAEVFLGIGRNLLGNDNSRDYYDNDIVGRGGISLGYRF